MPTPSDLCKMFNKSFIIIVVLALLAVYVQANGPSKRLIGNKKHPTLEDHCYHEDYKVPVKLHETALPTNIEHECVKLECLDDFVLSVEACPVKSGPCVGDLDITKPFPDCCPC